MSRGEVQMQSEKEETSVNPEEISQIIEEIVPSSSPEAGFPNDVIEENLSNIPIEQPLQEVDHQEIVSNEPVEQLVENPGSMQNEGVQMIPELNDQNSILITQEDVFAAGIQVENLETLTDEQVGIILAYMEQRKQNMQVVETEIVEDGSEPHELLQQDIIHEELVPDENSVALIITGDGGLKIADHTQQEFHFSPEQLQSLNINVNELTEDDVQQLLHMAIPSISLRDNQIATKPIDSGSSAYNEDVINQMPSTSYHTQEKNHRDSLLGQTVQVRLDNGKIESAIVRYLRGSSEYKIQLMNGKFIYATIDQLIIPRRMPCEDSYPNEPLVRGPSVNKRQGAPLEDNDEMPPPLLKRSYQFAPAVDGPHMHHAPNFCCPICDRKVYQKEPSYIVIRLPACDTCTREKIIVLDEPNT